MRKGLALGRRGRKRTEAFYWGHLIDFWGRIFAFVLWCLYTYSVLLIINGCLSHISTWWGKDGLWAGEEGRGRGQGPADFRKSRWSVSFILGPLHSLIIYISLPGERINIVQWCAKKGWARHWAGEEGRGRRPGPTDSFKYRWSFISFTLGPMHNWSLIFHNPENA